VTNAQKTASSETRIVSQSSRENGVSAFFIVRSMPTKLAVDMQMVSRGCVESYPPNWGAKTWDRGHLGLRVPVAEDRELVNICVTDVTPE
jgi:hypothetical protein